MHVHRVIPANVGIHNHGSRVSIADAAAYGPPTKSGVARVAWVPASQFIVGLE